MPNYNLNISFDTADLATIVTAKQKVTLVKQNNQGVNPACPLNAVTVPYMHNTSFTPFEIVNVYLESNAKESMAITNVSSKPITVAFSSGVSNINIKYNKASGTFYQE